MTIDNLQPKALKPMIPYNTAYQLVLKEAKSFGIETINLLDSSGRILNEPIYADRDFPPFNRSTKDGICINFSAFEKQQRNYKIEDIAPAGSPQKTLQKPTNCLEIMTGAIVPDGCDTVIMYEDVEFDNDIATTVSAVKKGQNIHPKGSDAKQGDLLFDGLNKKIEATDIGVLATLGKTTVEVKKLPRIALISTGNELVEIDQQPKPYQIRRSNIYSLKTALESQNIKAQDFHITDDVQNVKQAIKTLFNDFDVLLLSGGVSKGKYDFLPEAFATLGVQKIFHKVKQRPGKPFWFGKHTESNTLIFSFPGNPNSTFITYQMYFLPWLNACLNLPQTGFKAKLTKAVKPMNTFTLFQQAQYSFTNGALLIEPVDGNGSGDLLSLSRSNCVAILPPQNKLYEAGSLVNCVPFL